MKLTTGILAITITITAGVAFSSQAMAQNPDAIDNARSVAKSLQQKQANDTNAALDAAGVPASKPTPGAPAPAVKPAVIPGSKPAAAASAAQSVSASSQHNQLQKVNVVEGADGVQIEIISNHSVTPSVSKLSSPARVLVALPETISAAPQNHISVGSAGVKGVRIGTDGKNPPTTSVVVDLDKACAYEIAPGPSGKLILTLHTDATAASASATAKSTPGAAKSSPAAKPQVVAKNNPAPAPAKKPAAKPQTVAVNAPAAKPATPAAKPQDKSAATKAGAPAAAPAKSAEAAVAKPEEKKDEKKAEDKKWAMNGKRDPFFSPVVQQNGSGCTTGKKCLEIGNINLRGVVKSDSGFIAVVTNNLNKAYFLRENDPVFNGYVVKITGDSVVFQETVQDKLGKPFTREVVKRIFTPAV
jgi:Tfp pilus assembly protein PilP